SSHAHPPYLHSFPTRRSSDLSHGFLENHGNPLSANLANSFTPGFQKIDHFVVYSKLNRSFVNMGCFCQQSHNSERCNAFAGARLDRKSTRLNSSHVKISYAVF